MSQDKPKRVLSSRVSYETLDRFQRKSARRVEARDRQNQKRLTPPLILFEKGLRATKKFLEK
jgi:hypothetical protein|tara:strand:- start:69 stop:254 length:186 start_codon:yes stop_codon:yes gene_type:complete